MDIRFVAKAYIDAGWAVVPLVKGEKRANTKWQKTTYDPSHFNEDSGIALKCGEPSGWRVDVDLDCPEAIKAAAMLLPNTGLIHGRPGKPSSHYWFICDGIKTTQFTDVRDSAGKTGMLVEIRSTGGYTAAPPSEHPSGDVLSWEVERDPLTMSPEDLAGAVRAVAIATLLSRHWPGAGVRHQATGHLAGFLCQGGIDPAMVVRIIQAAATIAGDADVQDRVKFARNTCGKFTAGENVTGGPKLAEALGDDVVGKMRSWLKLADGDAIEEMNERHFWVRMGKDDVIGRLDDPTGVVFQKPKALYSEYANKKIMVGLDKKGEEQWKPLFQAWLEAKNRRSYRQVVFAPPPHVCHESDFNLWSGFAIEPKDGECPLFLHHLEHVICSGNAEHYLYLLNLLALTCQEPGTPSEVAVAMRGEQGTGKGTFVRALGRIFGKHFAHLDKTSDLVGGFNAAISGKVIVFADEAFWAGDKKEVASLKRVVTEPTLRITRKGIDSVEEANHMHLFMATNFDWSIPAGMKERRFFALEVSSARIGDYAYFDAIEDELRNGGLAAFLYGMLHRQIDRRLLRNVPRTKELRDQQGMSLTPELEWWQDCLYEGRIGGLGWQDGQWIQVSAIFDEYQEWGTRRKARLLSKVEFGRRMAHYMTDRPSMSRKIGGEVLRCVHLLSLADARKALDAAMSATTEWPDTTPAGAPAKIPF